VELAGYIYDCMAHPTLRKRKHGCLSGISKAGHPWFTLQQKCQLKALTLKHTQIKVPNLIGPHTCSLKTVSISGE